MCLYKLKAIIVVLLDTETAQYQEIRQNQTSKQYKKKLLKPTYQRHERGTNQSWFLRQKYRGEGPRCQQKRRKPCQAFFLEGMLP